MTKRRQIDEGRRQLGLLLPSAAVGVLFSCKTEDPPRPTVPDAVGPAVAGALGAPRPIAPVDQAVTPDAPIELRVENADGARDGSDVTYRFELSSDDDGFEPPLVVGESIRPGSETTSWAVEATLEPGTYIWRARAETAAGLPGPFSEAVSFELTRAGIVVTDSLMNGASAGDVGGGRFTSAGWEVTSAADFLRYAVPTLADGFIEWENTGLQTTNPAVEQVMLLGMWDASPEAGPYRTNAFRMHLRKLDDRLEPPLLRLRWIANGEQHDTGANVERWEPGRVYRWRIEWGPGPLGNAVQVSLDGVPLLLQQYTRDYAPRRHWIEFGVEERRESIVGATYANVRIGRRS